MNTSPLGTFLVPKHAGEQRAGYAAIRDPHRMVEEQELNGAEIAFLKVKE
jgi:hypothetical protein